MERTAWIEVAKQVLAGNTAGLKCPICGHDALDVEWLPFDDGTGGEFRIRCRNCGAQNFVLKHNVDKEN
jgi:DNA-directed RNA polymerase subunit RPC12/RpoP